MRKSTGVPVPGLLARRIPTGARPTNTFRPPSLYIYMTHFAKRRSAETAGFPEMSACKLGKYQ